MRSEYINISRYKYIVVGEDDDEEEVVGRGKRKERGVRGWFGHI